MVSRCALALAVGFPMPLLSLILLIVGLVRRPNWVGPRAAPVAA
jgi:hypothetical protein